MRAVRTTRSRFALPTTITSNGASPPGEPDSAGSASPHTDGCDQSESCGVALVFRFATPEAVLVVLAGEIHAIESDGAAGAHLFGVGLASLAGLRTLRGGRKEQVREPTTGPFPHPVVVRCDPVDRDLDFSHCSPP